MHKVQMGHWGVNMSKSPCGELRSDIHNTIDGRVLRVKY